MTNAYTQTLAMALSSLPEAIAQTRNTRNRQKGTAVLVMRSGVSDMNDQEIGAFRCGHTAELCGLFLLALDSADHPEYLGFDLLDDQGNTTLQHRNITA